MTPGDIVLVIDDSPGTLGMLNDTLELAGYTVLVAQSAAAALALASACTPNCSRPRSCRCRSRRWR